MTVSKITSAPTPNETIGKINEIIDNLGGGGTATDVQINGTSITSNNVANIVTNSAYNASSNKIATMADVPSVDSALSSTSTNPVQNKVINTALSNKYDASNPNGYTSNVGTVTKVNNTSPDSSGNVTLSIPAAQIQSDWTQTTTTAKDYIKNKPSLSTVATSGSYNDLTNKPTIPTVNNATLTIQKNGSTVKTFTANASSNVTCNITVPTKTSDITNDSGYITGISSSDVTTALGYTPYNSSNPNGYTSNVGTVTSVNNTSPDSNGNVTLSIPTVPTNISAFNNDSGYITGITSGDVTTALGYTPANTTLSNLSSTSSTNFDGQWVSLILPLTTSTTSGTFTINLGTTGTSPKNYLPNDNYSYEVLVTFTLQHNGATGGGNAIVVGNESVDTAHTDRSGDTSNNTRIIVVNSSRSFDYTLGGKNVSSLNIEAVAYRRLGTNT